MEDRLTVVSVTHKAGGVFLSLSCVILGWENTFPHRGHFPVIFCLHCLLGGKEGDRAEGLGWPLLAGFTSVKLP